jgi:hypothetical protein
VNAWESKRTEAICKHSTSGSFHILAPLDIAKLDLAAVTRFDAWRTQKNGKVPAQSTVNNHNSALARVLDEAELNGWIVKSLRPTLLNKGVKTQSRGIFWITL